jgi:hypothetical protein
VEQQIRPVRHGEAAAEEVALRRGALDRQRAFADEGDLVRGVALGLRRRGRLAGGAFAGPAGDPDRERRDWRELRGLIETSWGYAITCHKSQGSQWENVIVYDDRLSRTAEDRARWLYTAITRAERGLVLLD